MAHCISDKTTKWSRCFAVSLLLSLLFVGCAKHSAEQGCVPAGNKYATGFQITQTDTATVVEVYQPYQRLCVREPLRRLGTMSTVQVGFLYALDAIDCLSAVCNPELIFTPIKGEEIDLGDSDKYRRHWPYLRDRRIDSYAPIVSRWLTDKDEE